MRTLAGSGAEATVKTIASVYPRLSSERYTLNLRLTFPCEGGKNTKQDSNIIFVGICKVFAFVNEDDNVTQTANLIYNLKTINSVTSNQFNKLI